MDTLPFHAHNSNSSLPETPGIYKITFIANGRIYIGSTVNLLKRKRHHFGSLRKNDHRNAHLQKAWNKHGENKFTFEVLEFVLIPEMLTAREQYYFDALKPFSPKGFNIAPVAGSNRGKKHTPEARVKMGLPNIGNKYNLGRKPTPETLEKLRVSHRGKTSTFKGKHHTPEAIEKLRQASSEKKQTPEEIERRRLANTGKKRTPEQIERSRRGRLAAQNIQDAPPGMAWCHGCKCFMETCKFSVEKRRLNGLMPRCKQCRSKDRKKKEA